ncbi:MAG: acetyl xylan esterase [Verrucomicrobia bacterium]|nr:acetyl xylan esterase [Verrucomicrobiota bacterium]
MFRRTLLALISLKVIGIALACVGEWAAGAVVFFGTDLWVLYNIFVPTAQGLCPSFIRFETERAEIWLTLDDGPDPDDTPRILDLLDAHQARATFFVIGERAAAHPELVREIVRRGHEIGHHTFTHPAGTFWCAGPKRVAAELDETLRVLQPLTPAPRWFRAPVGIKNFLLARALEQRGLHCIDWSLRSGDWLSRRAEKVQDNVVRRLKPGIIVLMHEGPSVPAALRVTAVGLVLDALTTRGYRCVIPSASQLR